MNYSSKGDYKYLSEELMLDLKEEFISYAKKIDKKRYDYIDFESFMKIIISHGYIIEEMELLDLKGFINNDLKCKIDLFYFYVFMSRLYREFDKKKNKETLKYYFNIIDHNKDGIISKEELFKFFNNNKLNKYYMSIDEINDLFIYIDLNNNDNIELDEFINAFNQVF